MSKIAYMPSLVKGRYVHFSYSGESCAIRDFIATGAMAIRDYKTSDAEDLIALWIPADRVPYTDVKFWVKRLADYSREKLGERAVILEQEYKMSYYSESAKTSVINSLNSKVEPNNFSEKKPGIIFYGERGIVNSLFFELSDNLEAFTDFIISVNKLDGSRMFEKKIESYRIIIEPDFGKVGYGTTDAVITINDELLIFFEAKRTSFSEAKSELSYQIELNYSLAKYLAEVSYIPSEISLSPVFSSDLNIQRGTKRGGRKLYINDEHRFFFGDFIKCRNFSCLSLTIDKNEEPIYRYYKDVSEIDTNNLSWINYKKIREIAGKYNLKLTSSHLEMNRRHFGLSILNNINI